MRRESLANSRSLIGTIWWLSGGPHPTPRHVRFDQAEATRRGEPNAPHLNGRLSGGRGGIRPQ